MLPMLCNVISSTVFASQASYVVKMTQVLLTKIQPSFPHQFVAAKAFALYIKADRLGKAIVLLLSPSTVATPTRNHGANKRDTVYTYT